MTCPKCKKEAEEIEIVFEGMKEEKAMHCARCGVFMDGKRLCPPVRDRSKDRDRDRRGVMDPPVGAAPGTRGDPYTIDRSTCVLSHYEGWGVYQQTCEVFKWDKGGYSLKFHYWCHTPEDMANHPDRWRYGEKGLEDTGLVCKKLIDKVEKLGWFAL
jgi:hypothetical protein